MMEATRPWTVNRASCGSKRSSDEFQQCRFACPILSQDAERHPFRYSEAHPLHCPKLFVVSSPQQQFLKTVYRMSVQTVAFAEIVNSEKQRRHNDCNGIRQKKRAGDFPRPFLVMNS